MTATLLSGVNRSAAASRRRESVASHAWRFVASTSGCLRSEPRIRPRPFSVTCCRRLFLACCASAESPVLNFASAKFRCALFHLVHNFACANLPWIGHGRRFREELENFGHRGPSGAVCSDGGG